VSTNILIAIALFTVALRAQSPFALTGEVRSQSIGPLSGIEVQLYDVQNHNLVERTFTSSDGSFRFHQVSSGSYAIHIVSTPGAEPILEEYRQIDPATSPLILRLPEPAGSGPVSGTVSLRELQHPISKRALRAAVEAQQFSQARNFARAIAKLEEAVQIAPEYREAHINLGAGYAHTGRTAEALAQFQRALDIGPPDAIIYSNLAWAHLVLHHPAEAANFALKAVAMDPSNTKAQFLLSQALLERDKRLVE
jgi:tetratricopeptide (TPR) repeat protein